MSIGRTGSGAGEDPPRPDLYGSGEPFLRPGPDALPADSWEAPIEPRVGPQHGYRKDPLLPRRWLIIGLVLVALGTVVVLPILFSSSSGGLPVRAFTPGGGGADPSDNGALPGSPGDPSLVPATAAMPTVPDPTTTAPAKVVVPPDPNPGPTTVARTTTRPPAPAPITLEAEGPGTTITGSAFATAYPGASHGMIVRNIGAWDTNPGVLRFNNVVIPVTGRYVLTIYVVHLDGEPHRTAQIAVSGISPVTQTFAGTEQCCNPTPVTLTIPAGTHTITISNSTGHAPSVDKVVITPL